MYSKKMLAVICLSIVGLLVNCSGGPGDFKGVAPRTLSEDLVDLGFQAFQRGDYDSAKEQFRRAVNENAPDIADAYNGLGFCLSYQDSLLAAVNNFNLANDEGLEFADAYVGLAAVFKDIPNYSLAVQNATLALAMDEDYVFRFDSQVNFLDVHVILAQSNFRRGEAFFPQAQAEVDFLEPGNGLDPNNRDSWVVENVRYSTYTQALLMKIQLLEATFGTL